METGSILRRFVLVEIVLTVTLFSIGFVGDPFLPTGSEFRLDAHSEAPMTALDIILIPIDFAALVIGVVAWIGLWNGWRNARWLYTSFWCLALLLLLGHESESVASGPVRLLDAISTLVGGLILGLLYFSDLRLRYKRPQVA